MNKLNWLGLGIIGVAGVAGGFAAASRFALSNPTSLSSSGEGATG